MKRRQFLIASTGAAGGGIAGLLPLLVRAAQPCPPPSVTAGGKTVNTSCASAASQQADWIARTGGPGVVWAHNFDAAAEVNQFRETSGYGMDPTGTGSGKQSTVSWQPGGFAGGGFLRIAVPTGGTTNGQWSRPMSAIRSGQPGANGGAGNGKTVDDSAAGGAVALNTWDSSVTSTAYNWRRGYYAHPAVQQKYPYWPQAGNTGIYDGSSFYLQFRVRISSSRWHAGNPAGKLLFIDVVDQESDMQELVFRSVNNPDSGFTGTAWGGGTNPLLMYTSRGSYPNSIIDGNQDSSYDGAIEPGGPYASTCTYGNAHSSGACWNFPADNWTTLLLHFVPGQDNSNYTGNAPNAATSTWPYHDTTIEVWKCDPGETTYTKIFEKFNLAWFYYTDSQTSAPNGPNGMFQPPAFNEVAPSGYMNGVPATLGWTHDFTQFIFSQQFIPCPQVW
jgi:hypothetical protein